MHNLFLAFEAAWKVLLASLILGAGLPALFGLGVRSLAWGAAGEAEVHTAGGAAPRAHRAGRMLAIVLFAVVLYGVFCGLFFIVESGLGNKVDFTHVIPVIK
jgi:predicted secreted protein